MDHDILPGHFATPNPDGPKPIRAVNDLVESQVAALLISSPSYAQLPPETQDEMQANMHKISAYTAELIRDDWQQSLKLGQTPMVRKTRTMEFDKSALPADAPIAAQATARPMNEPSFNPAAANNVAQVTENTLNAIAFPTFVADLIKGTFNAIVDASIQQMEAFGELLSNVAKTVDDFMSDNISDNAARDWVASAFPASYQVDTSGNQGALRTVKDLSDADASRMRRTMGLTDDADLSDVEEVVVPAARRHLAQSRQQMLSSMMLMGINRINVTRGRIKAQMGFRIDTRDAATASASKKFDMKHENQLKYSSFLSPVSGSQKTSVAYVSSSQKDSENEIDVSANLTGEVDLQFKSDMFPLERFADPGMIANIQANSANPSAAPPNTGTGG